MLIISSTVAGACGRPRPARSTTQVAAVSSRSVDASARLRLDRHDAGAKPAKRRDAVADMGADVEHQVAGLHELGVEPVHRRARRAVAVIDAQRAHDPARGPQGFQHGVTPAARPAVTARQGERRQRRRRRSVSSGRRPMPMRASSRPSAGHAVNTASGIDSAGPPAMQTGVAECGRMRGGEQAEAGQSERGVRPQLTQRQRPRHGVVVAHLPIQPMARPNGSPARNSVWPIHMIGDSRMKNTVSVSDAGDETAPCRRRHGAASAASARRSRSRSSARTT